MNNDVEKMIAVLSPEIEKKCIEINESKKNKKIARRFIFMCIAVIVIPTLFVFFGFNLATLIVPVVFISVALLILSPILINQEGGRTYEQI